MRKFLGNFGGLAAVLPVLKAVALLFVLLPAIGHAEDCSLLNGYTGPPPSISSITPSVWYLGQTYTIVIKGNFPGDVGATYPGCEYNEDSVFSTVPGVNVTIESVPGLPQYSLGTFTTTQITLTVTVAANSATGSATVSLGCDGGNGCFASGPVQITNCPDPTVTAVSPNVWLAGKTYNNVTVAGTKFVAPPGQPPLLGGCPATPLTITTPSGAAIALGAVTVNSATKMTIATVMPPATEVNETATVTVSGNSAATSSAQIENPKPSIAKLQYTNSLPLWQDGPSNATPVAMSQTVWTPSSSLPSVFVSSTKIHATATFNVTPITVALSGGRIEANVGGVGLMIASGVSIPAGATSIPVTLSSPAFPDSQTQHYQPLGVTWSFSPSGQPCSSGPTVCEPAGSTSSEVYVTLATPLPMSESVMPLSAVELAIGSGGASTPTAAFQNTWQQFAGPANVDGWDGRTLYYYEQGVGFGSCATNSVLLLTSPTGSGQCGSWARLFMDTLAVNGISSNWTTVTPTVRDEMLINSWSFSDSPTYKDNAPWEYNFTPVVESEGFGMVPLPPNSVFGDLTNGAGIPGQNSPTPSEKFFTQHFIVKAPSSLGVGGPYFDPSYGATYSGNCAFESQAVAGYADRIAGTNAFYVEKPPSGGCNVTITP